MITLRRCVIWTLTVFSAETSIALLGTVNKIPGVPLGVFVFNALLSSCCIYAGHLSRSINIRKYVLMLELERMGRYLSAGWIVFVLLLAIAMQ